MACLLYTSIDEFDQISVNQQGFLKHLLQKPVANLRKPYGTAIQEIAAEAPLCVLLAFEVDTVGISEAQFGWQQDAAEGTFRCV